MAAARVVSADDTPMPALQWDSNGNGFLDRSIELGATLYPSCSGWSALGS